jgi:hypothetical protein
VNQKNDVQVLRDLVKRYLEFVNDPVMEERRKLWSAHHALKKTRPPVFVMIGMFNAFCRDIFGGENLKCTDDFYRWHEAQLRMRIFTAEIGDDQILEPWWTQHAAVEGYGGSKWGLAQEFDRTGKNGDAMHMKASLDDWAKLDQLTVPHHHIDEEETARHVQKIGDVIGDLIEINVERGPICQGTAMDISTDLAQLRGMQEIMMDMYEYPDELHQILSFMRDGILQNHREAEEAGDFSLTTQINQTELYCDGMEPPKANSGPRRRKELWACCMAQELTLVSPAFHDEFMLQYQIPIMKEFGLISYGCCENLTNKVDILRQIPNLRIIACTPTADPKRMAEQIGTDYIISYRPNPTNMVCGAFDEGKIRCLLRKDLTNMRGTHMQINLKDIETVDGELSRLKRWTQIARETIDEVWE